VARHAPVPGGDRLSACERPVRAGTRSEWQPICKPCATRGIVTFTEALAQEAIEHGVRVNCVAPGPVWTPLIPATMSPTA
jgi:hypothetical protein